MVTNLATNTSSTVVTKQAQSSRSLHAVLDKGRLRLSHTEMLELERLRERWPSATTLPLRNE